MPKVIGYREEAITLARAYKAFIKKGKPVWEFRRSPGLTGWKEVGSGVSRHAWLSPNGFVYKLPWSEGDYKANLNEIACIRSLRRRKMPDCFRLPAAGLYTVDGIPIVVMEYVNVEMTEAQSEWLAMDNTGMKLFKIFDWGLSNCLFDGEKYVPIDFGYSELLEAY